MMRFYRFKTDQSTASFQVDKERPWRRYDQDKDLTSTYRHVPTIDVSLGAEGSRTYRLDIELGRLEFLMHPGMAKEDLLVRRGGISVHRGGVIRGESHNSS